MNWNLPKKSEVRMLIWLGLIGLGQASSSTAATWEAQAERLQKVSASLLDAQPVLTQTKTGEQKQQFRIEGKTVVSVLPKMNATVGAKTEQPPQPPVHSIPTAEGSYISSPTAVGSAIVRGWYGYLPGAAAGTMGMKASCEQSIYGLSLGLKNEDMNFVTAALELGQQWNAAKVKGGITEPEAKDLFQVKTKLRFASLSVSPKVLPKLWAQGQVTERQVGTHFEIPADGTTFDLTDSSTIRGGNAASQVAIGYAMGRGFQAAVALLNVPQRSSIPRVLLSYSASTGSSSELLASH